ncbi:hypothetical protein Tco_0656245 [Tanacetum coccineum]|uniref:Secreted protein n=1 Tax=Tanacetum coccineum TaxID=301880 RepID=A0ABQ4X8G0_9ASTR
MFDEYFSPPTSVASLVPIVVASVLADSTAPIPRLLDTHQSPSTSQTPRESPSHVIPPAAEESDHDIEVAHMDNDPYVSLLIP